MSVPNLTAFFKKGKKLQAELNIEVKSEVGSPLNSEEAEEYESESSEEMILIITTLPAITAIQRDVTIEYIGESISKVVYESPRKINLPIITAFQKVVTLNDE